jgi:four helix bundle protein
MSRRTVPAPPAHEPATRAESSPPAASSSASDGEDDLWLPFQKLDAYLVAKELVRRVHEAKITDPELRDQATRAAKRTFLSLCEGLPHEGQALRRKYFVEANASLHETLGAVDLAATIEAMRKDDARAIQRLGVRLKRMLRGLLH